MKRAVLALLLCRLAAAQQAVAEAGVEGSAFDAETRQGLKGVEVVLAQSGTPPVLFRAKTDSEGHFSIAGVAPGSYFLYSNPRGYGVAAQDIQLKPGERKSGLEIAFIQNAAITGRVTDEFGDPVQGARIQAIPLKSTSGPLIGNMRGAVTDDRGEFRIGGPPGKYLIQAEPANSQAGSEAPKEIRTDGSQAAFYDATWYPSADSREQAKAIETAAGRETGGVDIRLIPRRAVSIGGMVTGRPDEARLAMVRVWNPGAVPNPRSAPADRAGKFSFAGLPGGDYCVQASWFGEETLLSPIVELHVESGDASGVLLPLERGGELYGSVEIPGEAGKGRHTITLNPISGLATSAGQSSTAAIAEDGTFHLKSLFPGSYEIQLASLPRNSFIESVRFGNAELSEPVVDLTGGIGSSKLKVTVSLNGATLEGHVVNERNEPTPLSFALVVLEKSGSAPGARSDSDFGGGFTFHGIAPGTYRLFAVNPTEMRKGGSFKALFEKGETIEIREGDRITKNARLVTP